jgi:exodeoxyribonuclease VII small subunit
MAETPKFEEGLAALEKLVDELEAGDLGLDEALKRYEKGMKLATQLGVVLEQSQRKVEKLGAGGLEPFAVEDDAAPAPNKRKAGGKKGPQGTLF